MPAITPNYSFTDAENYIAQYHHSFSPSTGISFHTGLRPDWHICKLATPILDDKTEQGNTAPHLLKVIE